MNSTNDRTSRCIYRRQTNYIRIILMIHYRDADFNRGRKPSSTQYDIKRYLKYSSNQEVVKR